MGIISYSLIGGISILLVSHSFGFNFWGTLILSAIFGFIINNALPMRSEGYPFLRFGVLFFLLFNIQQYIGFFTNSHLDAFYNPTTLWKSLLALSFVSGMLYSFGKQGRGTDSRKIQRGANVFGMLLLLISTITFWWHGAVYYLLARIPLIFIENLVVLYFFKIIGFQTDSQLQDEYIRSLKG